MLGGVAPVRRLLLPVVSSLYAVPLVILYPAMTAWFGLGSASKIAFAALYAVFPVALAVAAGMRTIDPNLILTARSMGARPAQLLFRVVMPASVPLLLAALRLGGALCIVGVVVAEMLVSTAGIGFLITGFRTTLDSPHVFAAVLLVVVVIALFDAGARWIERRAAREFGSDMTIVPNDGGPRRRMIKKLTLTFDNGPDPAVTPGVLDVLRRRGIATTFFVIGEKLRDPAARACAERAHDEGHWIGNHTWTHSTPLGEQPGADAASYEITQTQVELGALAHSRRLFRPMGGGGILDRKVLSAAAVSLLQRDFYTCVLWNAVPRDWADPDGWVSTALAQIDDQPWPLVVLHDLPTGAMLHLERFLDEVGQRGFTLHQDVPPACVPIDAGRLTSDISNLVTN